jgi:hypothetical protein
MKPARVELLSVGADGRVAQGPMLDNVGKVIEWVEPAQLVAIDDDDGLPEVDIYVNRAYLCVFAMSFGVQHRKMRFYVPHWLTESRRVGRHPSPYACQLANEVLRPRA